MSNLTTSQPAAGNFNREARNNRMAESVQTHQVPLRRGSRYTDILLQRLQSEVFENNSPAVIGVASFAPRQGVTTTALNLGIRAADHRISPTLVVDGNFQDQRVSRIYRTGKKGLTECLIGRARMQECVKPTKVDNLSVLGIGQTKIAKQLVMATQPSIELLEQFRESYQLTIIDLPAINEPSLADAFMPHLDGVVLVARYGVKKEKLQALQEHIRDSGGKIVGAVMTGKESKLPKWLSRFL
jgi:Mrp family chromosome partitioning ATPase